MAGGVRGARSCRSRGCIMRAGNTRRASACTTTAVSSLELLRAAAWAAPTSRTSTSMRIMATACSTRSTRTPTCWFADVHEDGRVLYPGTGHVHSKPAVGRGRGHEAEPAAAIPAPSDDDVSRRVGSRRAVSRRRPSRNSSSSSAAPTASPAIRSRILRWYARRRTAMRPPDCVRTRRPPFGDGRLIGRRGRRLQPPTTSP